MFDWFPHSHYFCRSKPFFKCSEGKLLVFSFHKWDFVKVLPHISSPTLANPCKFSLLYIYIMKEARSKLSGLLFLFLCNFSEAL